MPPRRATLDAPLTFPTAAKAIGWPPGESGGYEAPGRRLRRLVLRRERDLRRPIALRDRRGDARWVTLGDLQRLFPELRETKTAALVREFQNYREELDHQVRRIIRDEVRDIVREELRALGMRGAA